MSLFGFDQAPKIFIFAGPTDMRKGFDSLSGLVSNEMQMDPLSGYLFVFMNKNRIKNWQNRLIQIWPLWEICLMAVCRLRI